MDSLFLKIHNQIYKIIGCQLKNDKKCWQHVPAFHVVDIDHSVVSEHSLYIYLRQYFEHRSVFKK